MKNKKIILVSLVLIFLILSVIAFAVNKNTPIKTPPPSYNNQLSNKIPPSPKCAKVGESIGSCVGCATECCDDLKLLNKFLIDGDCINYVADGAGLICSNCGNGICDEQNSENNCNCPEDCVEDFIYQNIQKTYTLDTEKANNTDILLTKNKENNMECNKNDDCGFFYLDYSEDNACDSCYFANNGWDCMNKEEGSKKEEEIVNKIFGGYGRMPLCERCWETDRENYSCECIENKCKKVTK